MPFYNLSRTVLTICFNTKNQSEHFVYLPWNSTILTFVSPPSSVGMNFGIQIAWVVVNIITITLFSMFVSKRFLNQYQKSQETASNAGEKHEAGAV